MIDPERAWARQGHRFPGKSLRDFRFIAIGQNFTLSSAAVSGLTRVDFPAGALILGITGGSIITGSAATTVFRDWKQTFAAQIDFPQSLSLTTGNRLIGGSLFGSGEICQFPAMEVYVSTNGSLNYTVENLTTSTLVVTITHHCLIPGAIS